MASSNLKVVLTFVVSAVAVTIISALLFPHHPMADLLRSSLQKPTATITPSPQEPNKIEATQNPDAYVGIGIEGFPIVNKLMIGKPAHKAGIQVDDVIEQIDEISIEGLSAEDISNKIRGEAGTTVVLTVHRPSTNQNLTIPLVREVIDPAAVSYLCGDEPVRGFGTVWQNHPEIRYWLDCPFVDFKQKEHATVSTFQHFEHGLMLWFETESVQNIPAIYVLYDDTHTYSRYDNPGVGGSPATLEAAQKDTYKPGPRFAKIYWEEMGEEGQQRLGKATGEARDSQAAFQEFIKGRMFWVKETDRIYIIYDGNYDPDANGQFIRMQGWMSFEDIFED